MSGQDETGPMVPRDEPTSVGPGSPVLTDERTAVAPAPPRTEAASPAVASGAAGGVGFGRPQPSASPATVGGAPGFGGGAPAVAGIRVDISKQRYGSHAHTPLPYLAAAAAGLAIAIGVVRWALETVPGAGRGGLSEGWWSGITLFLLNGQVLGYRGTDHGRLAWALVAMGIATVLVTVWIRRLGVNARVDAGFFGAVLVLLAIPAWYTLPVTIGNNQDLGLGEARLRLTILLVVLVAQALFVRWTLSAKSWRAGRLGLPACTFVLWLPLAVADCWYYGSTTVSMFSVHKDGTGHSKWEPTRAIYRADVWANRGTLIVLAVVLVVVTVRQHQGIAQDRADVAALNA